MTQESTARTAALITGLLTVVLVALWVTLGSRPEAPREPSTEGPAPRVDAPDRGSVEPSEDLESRRLSMEAASGSVDREPDATLEAVNLLVVDELGGPVEAVPVLYDDGNERTAAGMSDSSGTLRHTPSAPAGGAYYLVDTDSLVGRSNEVGAMRGPEPLVLTVFPKGAISGTVQRADGKPVEAGLRIVSYDSSGYFPSTDVLSNPAESGPFHAVASTDSLGRFRLTGLASDRTYTLEAGGYGLLTMLPLREIATGTVDLVLEVYVGYAGLIEFVDSQGGWVRGSENFLDNKAIRLSVAGESLSRVFDVSHACRLAGLPEWFTADERFYRRSLIYVDVEGSTGARSATLHANLPGYAPLVQSVPLELLAHGGALTSIEFVRLASGFGEIKVSFAGAPRGWSPESPGVARMKLRLTGEGGRLRYRFRGSFQHPDFLLADVPYGTYRPFLEGIGDGEVYGMPPEVIVGPKVAHLDLDLGDFSGLEVRIRSASGQRHVDYARVTLLYDGPVGSRPSPGQKPAVIKSFATAPYHIFPLRPGAYRIGLDYPYSAGKLVQRSIDMLPGAIELVEFRGTE